MTSEAWFPWIESLQILMATIGLVTACVEWRSITRLHLVWHTPGQLILARQALITEVLRLSVHIVIIITALISLYLPSPPVYMPHWITQYLLLRKLGCLWIAIIAMLGTVSARVSRVKFLHTQQ